MTLHVDGKYLTSLVLSIKKAGALHTRPLKIGNKSDLKNHCHNKPIN